mgnify:CR=1 FL=1
MLLFLTFFMNSKKEIHWFKFLEEKGIKLPYLLKYYKDICNLNTIWIDDTDFLEEELNDLRDEIGWDVDDEVVWEEYVSRQ